MRRLIEVVLVGLLIVAPVLAADTGLDVEVRFGSKPASGASVVLACRGKDGAAQIVGRATTDPHGKAGLHTAKPFPEECLVWAGGISGSGVKWARPDGSSVRLVLPPSIVVRLRAVDGSSGGPLPARSTVITADLELLDKGADLLIPPGLVTVTETSPGRAWSIHGLPQMPNGRVSLRVTPEGYASRFFRAIPLHAAAPVDLGDVPFHAVAMVCGIVRGLSKDVRAVIHLRPPPGEMGVTVNPQQDGSFCVKDLASDVPYDVWASSLYGETEIQRVLPPFKGVVLDLPAPRHVSGHVVDADHEPVTHFTISIMPSEMARAPELADRLAVVTKRREVDDAEGRFDIPVPTELEATVRIEADGFAPQTVVVPEGRSLKDVVVALEPGLSLRGVVTAADTGEPLPSASVKARCEGEWVAAVATDENGEFQLTGLPAGQCSLFADAAGFTPGRESADLGGVDGPDVIRLNLERAVAISGRVVDGGTDESVAGARIVALPMAAPGRNPFATGRLGRQLSVVSSADGSFRIEGCARGQYGISVSARGYVPETVTVEVEEGMPPLRVELRRGVVLEGVVLGARGGGAGLRVVLQQGALQLAAATGYGGAFRIEGVPEGAVRFSVMGRTERHGLCSGTLDVPPVTGTFHHDLDCRQGLASLAGVLTTAAGAPAVSVPLFLDGLGVEGSAYETVTGSDGRFRFDAVDTGSYRLRARTARHHTVNLWQGDVRGDLVLPLVLETTD